jgi:hypothetical protein
MDPTRCRVLTAGRDGVAARRDGRVLCTRHPCASGTKSTIHLHGDVHLAPRDVKAAAPASVNGVLSDDVPLQNCKLLWAEALDSLVLRLLRDSEPRTFEPAAVDYLPEKVAEVDVGEWSHGSTIRLWSTE